MMIIKGSGLYYNLTNHDSIKFKIKHPLLKKFESTAILYAADG